MNKTSTTKGFSSPKDYWPLLCLVLMSAVVALALQWHTSGNLVAWMHYFMGFFFCCFAMFKLFKPSHFADGFQMYDLLGKHIRLYAYIYPFIELLLGLCYFSFFNPTLTYLVTIFFLSYSAVGVIIALKNGLNVNCACMGSILEVPLSTVTLTEDISMILMATIMLLI